MEGWKGRGREWRTGGLEGWRSGGVEELRGNPGGQTDGEDGVGVNACVRKRQGPEAKRLIERGEERGETATLTVTECQTAFLAFIDTV